MSRPRVKRIFPIMLSLASASVACDLPAIYLKRAIASGALEAREGPGRRVRICVVDLIAFWKANHKRVTS
jgi:hypothetical protein